MNNRWKKLLCVLCTAAFILTSCSSKEEAPPKVDMNEPFVLRVGASDLLRFLEVYYDALIERFPQMELDFMEAREFAFNPLPGERPGDVIARQYREFLSSEQPPDVLMYSNVDSYQLLIDNDMIEPLDARIKRDQYDTSPMYKPGIDNLRTYGGGMLYGLAPFFVPEYMTFFNQELFSHMGVAVPQAPYTWNDLIELGGRFAGQSNGDEAVSGFAFNCGRSTGFFIKEIGRFHNLKIFNDNYEMTFQGDAWKQLLEPLAEALMNGSYQVPADTADSRGNCLSTLKSTAIVVADADAASTLQQLSSPEHPANIRMDVPPSPDNGQQFGSAMPQEIFSIVKGSPVAEQAWEVIKAINDEQFAQKLSAIVTTKPLLPMREGIPYHYSGNAVDQFYAVKDSDPDIKNVTFEEKDAFSRLVEMITQEFEAMKTEERSLEDMMAAVQQKGNELLTAYKANLKDEKNG